MNYLDYKIDGMTIKEMIKTFVMVVGGLMGFGIFYFISTPLIWFYSNQSTILIELWTYTPVYFLIIFTGWIIYYAITPDKLTKQNEGNSVSE